MKLSRYYFYINTNIYRGFQICISVPLNKVPKHVYEVVPSTRHSFRNPNSFVAFPCRIECFKNSFLLCVINDWKKLDPKIYNSIFYLSFRNTLINFFRPWEKNMFNIHDKVGIKLLTKLRLGFSHLGKYKFGLNFGDTLNILCSCSVELEMIMNFFCDANYVI